MKSMENGQSTVWTALATLPDQLKTTLSFMRWLVFPSKDFCYISSLVITTSKFMQPVTLKFSSWNHFLLHNWTFLAIFDKCNN